MTYTDPVPMQRAPGEGYKIDRWFSKIHIVLRWIRFRYSQRTADFSIPGRLSG
jgi:hypothetical protein